VPRLRSAALFFLTLTAVAHAACPDGPGQWVDRAPLALARQEVGAARIGGKVYVVGGLLANSMATDTVEAYDIAADAWSSVASIPAPRDHMAVAATGGILYVAGGFAGDFQARSEAFAYDPSANAWTPIAPLPAPRGGCWAVALAGKVYLFGGVNAAGAAQKSVFVYDPGTNQWSTGADMPTAREHLNAAAVGDFIYVIGGRDGGSSTNANERYHPATDTWEPMTPMPTARAAAAVASFGNRIFAAGGETPMLFSVHEVYDVATDSWSNAATMAIPRHGIAAVTLDDRILTPGGGVVQGLQPTAAVDSFVPSIGAAAPACPPAPGACRAPAVGEKGLLLLRRGSSPARSALVWDWARGTATTKSDFGDPVGSDGYALCVYAGGAFVTRASAPAGSACPGRTGWRSTPGGFRYRSRARTPDGLKSVALKQGADGRARIVVKGRGALLPLPDLAGVASPITVQLRRSGSGPCWSAQYGFPPAIRADATTFKDRAD
jgi:N-acetylneuraminic acid mutarotase